MNNYQISKRKKTAVLFFSYGFMTLATIVISIICVLLISGFRFDTQKGTIEQGGLFQFRSFPSAASITIDDKPLNFKTPGKYNVDAGTYKVSMQLAGYQDWQKTSSIKAGELKWLNYARMVPNTITTIPIRAFPDISDSLPSPDRRWFSIITDSTKPEVTLFNIQDPAKPVETILTIPAESYTSQPDMAHTFELEEWDFGAKYLLVKHTIGPTVEYLKVDRTNNNEAVNITQVFNLPFAQIHFSGTSGNVFYGLNGTDIRRIDLEAKAVSQPIVQDASSFELYKSDVISYIATRDDKQLVGVYIDNKETIVRSYPAGQAVAVDVSSYFNNEYLVIANGKKVEIIKDPLSNADSAGRVFANFDLKNDALWAQFSNGGRFVVVGNGTQFTTYDIETDEVFSSQFDGVSAKPTKPLQWLDDYYLTSSVNGSLIIAEFDGTNRHTIAAAAPGLAVTLSDDGEYLFSFVQAKNDSVVFQSSKMITR